MDTEEHPPTEFSTTDTKFLEVSIDKLTVSYNGKGSHSHDVGAIRANRTLPTNKMIAYFEVTVEGGGTRSTVCVGLSQADFLLNRHPGWEDNSYGYLGEDGKKYHEGTRGEAFGETFGSGDVIGCGIFYHKQEVFYTKNGKYLGVAFKKVKGVYYPTVGLHSPGEIISINFGQKPFRFDIEGYINEQKQKIKTEINSLALNPDDVHTMIRDYLLHYGYENTLKCFETSKEDRNNKILRDTLLNRKKIRQSIMDGDIETAQKFLQSMYPAVVSNNQEAMLHLYCQNFIEQVRKGETVNAIQFAQTALPSLSQLTTTQENYLQEVLGLLAYEKPENSPIKHLLSLQQREDVADFINNAILALESGQPQNPPSLERALKQLVVVQRTLREKNGGKGERFSLQDFL